MRLKPGDRVKIMDDAATYTVVRRMHGDFIIVRTNDGLEMPILSEQLILSTVKPENLTITDERVKGCRKTIVKKKVPVLNEQRRSKVVDLHMANNYGGAKGLTIIEMQLMRFRSELDTAIRDGFQEITFIHGVGSGVLKQELIKILSNNYPSLSYHDASYKKYGYEGATQVLLNKK